MKKSNWLFAGAILILAVAGVYAAPRQSSRVLKTSLNEGNDSNPYVVFATSETWTSLLLPDFRRRSSIIQTLSDAGDYICLSTSAVQAACNGDLPGLKIPKGSSANESSEEGMFVRIKDLTAGTSVYAKEYFDNKDVAGQD